MSHQGHDTTPAVVPSTTPVLELSHITKRFGALTANDDISLTLGAGEVLALLGENGAGKSTLMAILFGHYVADEGSIRVHGQALPSGNPSAALAAGIGMVHQHFALADNLTVLDNILLGTESLWSPVSHRAAARDKLMGVSQQFGLVIDPDAKVASLSVGERQRVEILKALYRGARILILDEPTAVLTPQESEALFDTLSQMVAQGLSIIFISHKLAEVLRVSHRIAVLRHGKLVAEMSSTGATQGDLASAMVGRSVQAGVRHPTTQRGAVVCALDQVHTPAGRDALRGASLEIAAGEIVAVAGVSGNGQVALAGVLSGMVNITQGRATLLGKPLPTLPSQLVAQGVARIPEDRHGTGVVGDLPVWENAVSEYLHQRGGALTRFGFVKRAAARFKAKKICDDFDVRGGGLDALARSLSGGNMQKLVLGRALSASDTQRPTLIVAHQPTWGLDIGAVTYVQQQLLAARDAGAAVLLISDDLDEVMLMGDRIAVMHEGHLTPALDADAWTRQSIGMAMAGSAEEVSA